jgi:hypothetical protein
MRTDTTEYKLPTHAARSRRIWFGHGCSRLVNDARDLPPAAALDEAIAGFELAGAPVKVDVIAHGAHDHRPMNASVVAGLSAQLDAIDRQREQLAKLLRSIDGAGT